MIGPIMGPIARRLADRVLLLALGVLHQPARRHRHRARPAGLHGRDRRQPHARLRLVRLCRAQHRHRRAAADARPRRAARLVRFQRDRADGASSRRVAFYFFIAALADDASSRSSPIEIFRDRNFIIGLVFMFVCGVMLVATMALMAPLLQNMMGYPDHRCRPAAGHARPRHGRRHADGGPADDAASIRACCSSRPDAAASCSLYYSIDFTPDTAHAHDRVDQHAAGLRARLHVRAAQHHRARHRAGRACARRAPPCGR